MIGIYKITSPTNKVYIGQSINIERRFKEYQKLYCKQQTKLYFSLKKYGPENHIFEIIEECKECDLIQKETYWKSYYKVLEIPSLCCRIDGKGGKNSKITNKLISKNNKGISRNKGRIQSEDEKKLRSQIKLGYKPSLSHIENMKKSMIGKNNIPIICINDNKVYQSIKEAASFYNLKPSSIDNILSGRAISTRKEKLKFRYINH
jgi:group I intron endonuclease